MGVDPVTLGMCSDGESKWQPVGAQEDAQPTKPHWLGHWQLCFQKAEGSSASTMELWPLLTWVSFSFSWYHSYSPMVLTDPWLLLFKVRVLDPALPLTLCVTLKLLEP